MDNSQVFVANETFACEIEGERLIVHKNITKVRKGHPLWRAHKNYFDPIEEEVQYDIEEATAPPTRRRTAKA